MSQDFNQGNAVSTYETAATTYIDVKGIRFTYRSLGQSEGLPIIFLQHFTGTLDNWDPKLINEFAKSHPVILFNNRGVGSSEGKTPTTVSEMAEDAYDFMTALQLKKVCLLGFSLGGFIAQHLAEKYPELVNKVILAGTGPKGSEGITDIVNVVTAGMSDGPAKVLRNIFFTKTANGLQAGEAFLERLKWRSENRDTPTTGETVNAQAAAIISYGKEQDPGYQQLRNIKQPTLIVNGTHDLIVPAVNSFTLSQYLINSTLILWSDSGHGAIFQYSQAFVASANAFLAGE